jgi:hypothetical protein
MPVLVLVLVLTILDPNVCMSLLSAEHLRTQRRHRLYDNEFALDMIPTLAQKRA